MTAAAVSFLFGRFCVPEGTQALAPLPDCLLFLRLRIMRARASGEAFLKWLRSVLCVCCVYCVRLELLLPERTRLRTAPPGGTIPPLLISGRKPPLPWELGALGPIACGGCSSVY